MIEYEHTRQFILRQIAEYKNPDHPGVPLTNFLMSHGPVLRAMLKNGELKSIAITRNSPHYEGKSRTYYYITNS